MKRCPYRRATVTAIGIVAAAAALRGGHQFCSAQPAEIEAPGQGESSCLFCHGKQGPLAATPQTRRLVVTDEDLAGDVHWRSGFRCHDCHGGSPSLDDYVDHRDDPTFYSLASPREIPGFCGRCHSDIEFMRDYRPSPRVDQEAEYWTSGHGQRLRETSDDDVATCVSCHGYHDVRKIADLESPVFPTNVAATCATCHANADLMRGREYRGRSIGASQFQLWSESVHARALLVDGDLSAATCNDCHGNHGALPPNTESVANACGVCHVKVAELFSATSMKHRFEQIDLPGCSACHGHHDIVRPTVEMVGMSPESACAACHASGKYGAPLAGAEAATRLHHGLEGLGERIALVEQKLDKAERLGMEVQRPRFRLRDSREALTTSKVLVHTFNVDAVEEELALGMAVTALIDEAADAALAEHTRRRIWLGLSLVPILAVVGLLVLYIRTTTTSRGLRHSEGQMERAAR